MIFKRSKNFYFFHSVDWEGCPQMIEKGQLEEMEYLLNKEMRLLDGYVRRKSSAESNSRNVNN
ncbi:hypothetical protein NCCP133_15650 [Cytobacillus sp. NCCP-133]|nr:hypothetical protein NCCP133_15650 [Cytobacillus sp. NCCP-133]